MEFQTIKPKLGMGDSDFDFYRCYKCKRLITRVEEIRAFSKQSKNPGAVCACGSPKYSPANMRWYEWLLPRVWQFAYLRLKGVV